MPFADWGDGRRRAACRRGAHRAGAVEENIWRQKTLAPAIRRLARPALPSRRVPSARQGPPSRGASPPAPQAEEFAQTASAQRYAGYRSRLRPRLPRPRRQRGVQPSVGCKPVLAQQRLVFDGGAQTLRQGQEDSHRRDSRGDCGGQWGCTTAFAPVEELRQ